MDTVLRAAVIYLVLVVVLRLAGRRTLSETTTFDFVLLLIIGEATQQALLGDDFSLTTAVLSILTLVTCDVALSYIKGWLPGLARVLDGEPTVVVVDGRALEQRMRWARIDVEDVLEAARRAHGIAGLERIRFAVLERNGAISIIPKD